MAQAVLSYASLALLYLVGAWGLRSAARRAWAGEAEAPFAVRRERARQRAGGTSRVVLVVVILAVVGGSATSLVLFGRSRSWPIFVVSELPALQWYLVAVGADVELFRRGKRAPFAVIGVTAAVVAFVLALGGGVVLAGASAPPPSLLRRRRSEQPDPPSAGARGSTGGRSVTATIRRMLVRARQAGRGAGFATSVRRGPVGAPVRPG